MKYILKIAALFSFASILLFACKKDNALPTYGVGVVPVLSASSTNVASSVTDSSKVALSFNWTNPNFSTDSANTKYVLEIDSAGKNFTHPISWTFIGIRTKSFTGAEINALVLDVFGLKFNVAYSFNARVRASHVNNNDMKISNTVTISATAYEIPPKIELPVTSRLFIVGGATAFGWTNSSTVDPAEEFSRISKNVWAGVFDLTGGQEYLVLPQKGAWATKFATPSNSVAGIENGGDFKFYSSGGDNFKAPSTSGKYLITFDFQYGKFTCEAYTGPSLATNLFITGGATPSGWVNPVPAATQQFTRLNSAEFELASLALTVDQYLLLPVNGSWNEKYAVEDNSIAGTDITGPFKYYTSGGQNMKAPATAGNYKINVNFATGKYKLTKL